MTLYTHSTLQSLVDQLAQELNDSGKVFHLEPELLLHIKEALRFWNLLTGYSRTTVHFSSTAGQAFYDLSSVLSSQLGSTVTDRDLVGTMQYRLMEEFDSTNGSLLSEMYTHASMVRSVQQRRDRFLAETEQIVSRKDPIFVSAGDGIVDLDEDTITVVRAVWKSNTGQYHNLIAPTDESAATSMLPSWRQSPGIPRTWSIAHQPNLSLQLIPPPVISGQLYLMTVESGAPLDTTAGSNGTVLGVHDDSAWGIGWGAMEEQLMRDGIGRDPARAEFASRMSALCTDVSTVAPSVLGVAINGRMVEPTSLKMLDSMRAGWEGRNTGVPTTPALCGDWLALSPVPDDSYDIGITLVQRMPIPALSANIQLGPEQLAGIIGWAKQLALFKCQGEQLQQGIQAGGAFIEQARLYNEQRIVRSSYLCEMYGLAQEVTWHPPRKARGEQSADNDPQDTASSRQSRGRNAQYNRPRRRLGGR